MSSNLKRLVIAGVIAATVVGFGAGAALADGPGEMALWRIVVQAVADATGLTPAQVIDYASAGQTLAEIAEANGADVDAVADAAIQQATATIEQAVANGTITQEEADILLADLEEEVYQALNGTMPTRAEAGQTAQEAGMSILIQVVAEATGLTEEEIMAALQAGQTLLDIIEEAGADVDAIVSETMDLLTQALEEAVAAGRISQEQADTILANLESRIERALETPMAQQGREQVQQWARIALQLASEATGLTQEQIMVALQSGQSLADIITSNGGDPEAVAAQLEEQIRQQIEQALANGQLSQERADALMARVQERVQQAVYGSVRRGDGLQASISMTGAHIVMEALAELTGQSWNQVAAEMWSGQTPSQIAQAHGVSEEALMSRVSQMATEAIDQAVAAGQIAPELSQIISQQLTRQLEALVNQGMMQMQQGMPAMPGVPGAQGVPGMQGAGQGQMQGGMPGNVGQGVQGAAGHGQGGHNAGAGPGH